MKSTPVFLIIMVLLHISLFSCRSKPPVFIDEEAAAEEIQEAEEEELPDIVIELPPEGSALPVSVFPEVWAYVLAGRESALRSAMPISDVAYFGAEIDTYGSLVDVPRRRNLPAFSGRVHLVVACSSRSLSHFILVPGSAERKALVSDLLSAARDYDGLQIDFELIPQKDRDTFFSFLTELRSGLGNKMFTIALPARTRKIVNDVYDYERIAPVVDRILVMAYDEHWSTSAPGPIASLVWCSRVADYSLRAIGHEKLIMGLPFYGRAWASPNHAQAYVYTGIERIINENNVREIRRENGIPTFDYQLPVLVKAYYEDEYSLSTRMEMYRSMGIAAIGFWRLGQETPEVWKLIKIGN